MEEKFCQCCGMPMGETDALYGTEKDGRKSQDYCKYCYENGEILFHGTMEEMIDFCIKLMLEEDPGLDENEARDRMKQWFPTLKYWKKA